jgi:hypothetical protein
MNALCGLNNNQKRLLLELNGSFFGTSLLISFTVLLFINGRLTVISFLGLVS